jgi:glutaconate CoA-transferase subunit A
MAKTGDKLQDLSGAISRFAKPGDSIALGLALEGFVPFAAVHEIIRQGIGPLTLIGPISNIPFDQLAGSGLAERVIAAWVGNVSTGLGHCYRRAVEKSIPRPLEVINHSNFSVSLALEAGARGLPMAVSQSPQGSDIIKDNPHFKRVTCPFSGRELLAIKALKPDLTIIHTQKADREGNAMCWGAVGISRQAAYAAEKVIITCEEIVPGDVIRSDPDRTLVPGFLVDAVCEVPWGAHPAPVQGYYGLDNEMYVEYSGRTRDQTDAEAWFNEWIHGVKNREEYVEKLGRKRLTDLMVKHPAKSAGVDYGW